MNDRHDLELLLRSRIPIIAINSREERRVLNLLRDMRHDMRHSLQQGLYKWTLTEGLLSLSFDYAIDESHDQPEEILAHIKSVGKPGIYVLVDFHPFLNDPLNVRLLKDIALQHDSQPRTIVLLSHELKLPAELRNYATRFSLSLPHRDMIRDIVRQVAKQWSKDNPGQRVNANRQALEQLINNLAGLTAAEARRLAYKAIYDDGAIQEDDLPRIMQAKYELLSQDGILHFEYDLEEFANIGGFRHLKTWLEQRRHAFAEADHPLDPPRGILLLGVQGCGKSLAARAVAGAWGIPLLRLDLAAMYNKFHGETERNLRESLNAAVAMSPCVLWIDEVEKGISVTDQDGGTSKRVLGALLTWMAENTAPVFLVATANDIESLPPELIRKGRLDEIFFVDLPDLASRKTIFEIHLRKRQQDPRQFNCAELARQAEGFSGAEIEQCVVSALYAAQARQQPLDDTLLKEELTRTRPLSVVMGEKIEALRNWARERTVSAG